MVYRFLFVTVVALLVLSACLPEHAATQPAVSEAKTAETRVTIDNFSFSPAEVTVPAGTKVTWVNHDDVPHTVTSSGKIREMKSDALDTDQSYSHTFKAPGRFEYYCAVHPHMTGVIVVK